MKTRIHIGCSAFNNVYWKGIFYPDDLPRTKWFEFYAQHFDTYELNGTFYRTPTAKSLKAWHDKVDDDFLFSVKAPRNVTHYKKFIGCENEIAEFYALCQEALQDKLAFVLFQLPPSFAYSPEKLELIVDSLDKNFRNVIEFRHKSWWIPEVYETLEKNEIVFCNVSYPGLPTEIVSTTSTGYFRLHGVPKLFYSGYEKSELEHLSDEIRKQKWEEVFVYFNNTADVHGVQNALSLFKNEQANRK